MHEKAKPVVRQGRKTTGLNETAGLPNETKSFLAELSGRVDNSVFLKLVIHHNRIIMN